jgi:hypothetical protein
MKKSLKKIKDYFCKLKIDSKTVIFVRNRESYKSWMQKYPQAIKIL